MPRRRNEPNGQLDLLLMATIAGEPQHGYAIIQRLNERSGGRFAMLEGTVYPALHRLEELGLVASRITGWTAHIMEQSASNSLIRPLSAYNGVEQRSL